MTINKLKKRVGLINAQGPPVPIPNTEVKLCSAENTLLATVREDRSRSTRSWERKLSQRTEKKMIHQWGCSSAGRAPALQAGGQEFESLHLHHTEKSVKKMDGHPKARDTDRTGS